jgi:hypothetical protein
MFANHAAVTNDMPARRRGKTRLRTLSRLDGRTRSAKRARELVEMWSAALGSPDAVQMMGVRHAAATVVILEDAQSRRLAGDTSITVEQITKLSNIMTRAVNALGLPSERASEREFSL